MTEEQKKAKENATKFITYLYKKYYPQIEAAMENNKETQKCVSFRILLELALPFVSYLLYNKRKRLRGWKNGC